MAAGCGYMPWPYGMTAWYGCMPQLTACGEVVVVAAAVVLTLTHR